jgi:hypothetical protein
VVWLPDTYQANDDKNRIAERVPTRAECGLPETGFVFCCFNNTFKINPQIFDVWMRLLAGTANSALWLLGTNPIAERNLRREAERRGIAAERLIFARFGATAIVTRCSIRRGSRGTSRLPTRPCGGPTRTGARRQPSRWRASPNEGRGHYPPSFRIGANGSGLK